MGTPANVVALGPGDLYIAEYGTTPPTDGTTTLPATYKPIGFTEDGVAIEHSARWDKVFVAEVTGPVKVSLSEESVKVSFTMAEATARNLAIALNQFDDARTGGTAVNGAVGTSRVVIVHESPADGRTVFYKAIQTGTVSWAFKKAPAKVAINVAFELEDPGSGLPLYKVFPSTSDLI